MKRSFHKFRHWFVYFDKYRIKCGQTEMLYKGRFHQGEYYLGHPVPGSPKSKSRSFQGVIYFAEWVNPTDTPFTAAYYYYKCQLQDHNNYYYKCQLQDHNNCTCSFHTIDKCYMFVLKY